LLESFDILNPDGSDVSASDYIYSRLDLSNRDTNALQFNTDIDMTDGTVVTQTFDFKIKTTARGKATLIKDVSITVTICGSETITPASESAYTQSIAIDP